MLQMHHRKIERKKEREREREMEKRMIYLLHFLCVFGRMGFFCFNFEFNGNAFVERNMEMRGAVSIRSLDDENGSKNVVFL